MGWLNEPHRPSRFPFCGEFRNEVGGVDRLAVRICGGEGIARCNQRCSDIDVGIGELCATDNEKGAVFCRPIG